MPIGFKLTGVVSENRMDDWMVKFDKVLADNEIKTYFNEIYVDDNKFIAEALEKGVRWDNGEMRFREEWREEDEIDKLENDVRTMSQIRKMANTIEDDRRTSGPR